VNPIVFPGGLVLLQIALRTLTVYAIVLIGVRLSGKREVGQMTPFDLTLLLLLSNAVQNAMTGPDTSLIGGATAAITLLGINRIVAELASHNRKIRSARASEATRPAWFTTARLWNAPWPANT